MLLNGLSPDRMFLEQSIMHCMRSSRIGDCFFYYNEMQRRGMQPSSKLQGLLISVLSREGHLKAAEEVTHPLNAVGRPGTMIRYFKPQQAIGIMHRPLVSTVSHDFKCRSSTA